MPFEGRLIFGLIVAVAAVYAVTPLAIRLAGRFNFYDKPMGYKGHSRPTPYLGGSAIMAGFSVVLLIAASGHTGRTLPLLGGMAVLWVVGTVDDRLNISPLIRVVLEAGIATFLWHRGLGWHIGLGGGFDLALTIVWVVAVVNAFNLFDNMDGATTTMAAVASGCLVVLGLIDGDHWLAVAAAVLCGACLGFLPHNMASPARIFLGDGGSMPIGFGVATLVMIGCGEAASAWQSLFLGLLLVGVPATDTCLVILSRRRRGVGVLTGGRDHLTHRTRQWFRTARAVAGGLGAIQALVSAIALFAIKGGGALFVMILVLYLVAGAVAIIFLEARWQENADALAASGGAPSGWTRPRLALPPLLLLPVAFGFAAGLTPFASGIYSPGRWVPVGLVVLVLATAMAIARPPRVSRGQLVAGGALVGLGVWGLISAIWAPSIAEATTDANRWLVLAAVFATAIVLVRSERGASAVTAGLALGIAAVAGYVVVTMLGSGAGGLFLGARLNEPLGYVNADASTFLMGFWLWFSLTEHRDARVSGFGLGVSTLMAGLTLLTQSRGAAIAFAVSLVVVVLLPGRRMRRIFGLLGVGAALYVAHRPIGALWHDLTSTAQYSHRTAIALLVVSAALGGAWWAGHVALERLVERRPHWRANASGLAVGTLIALAIAFATVTAARAGSIEHYVRTQWHAFVHLSVPPKEAGTASATTHLASGAGFRYDYWRVALRAFEDHPLIGVGAGNYDRPYFRYRHTSEDVHQPHSLLMQELAELGLVGALLVLAFAGAIVLAIWRLRRRPLTDRSRMLAIPAAAVPVAWFVHTSVDWLHLVPGITAIALAMTAVLLRPEFGPVAKPAPDAVPAAPRRRRLSPLLAAGAASLVLVVAAASLGREGLAQLFRDRANGALPNNPAKALREANRSLRLDAENPETYYAKAAALARVNDAAGAQQTLRTALSKEPDNFVTWTLVGDLDVRVGNLAAAKRAYTTAHRLNPVDPTLAALARDPRPGG